MKVVLSYEVVHGTCNGGEDVFVKARIEVPRDSFNQDEEARKANLTQPSTAARLRQELLGDLVRDYPKSEEEDAADAVWVELDEYVLKTPTSSQYEFTVEKPLNEVLDDLWDLYLNGDWNYNLRTRTWWVEKEFYRHGNAD